MEKRAFRHFLKVSDLEASDIREIFDMTEHVRKNPEHFENRLSRKTVCLLFEKSSTRTRLSFEAGVHQMGGDTVFLGGDSQLARGGNHRRHCPGYVRLSGHGHHPDVWSRPDRTICQQSDNSGYQRSDGRTSSLPGPFGFFFHRKGTRSCSGNKDGVCR